MDGLSSISSVAFVENSDGPPSHCSEHLCTWPGHASASSTPG